MTDTIIVFAEKAVHFLASKKKIDFLRQLEAAGDEDMPIIKLWTRDKADNDKKNFEKLTENIKVSGKHQKNPTHSSL